MKKNFFLLIISLIIVISLIEYSLRIYGLGYPIIYESSLLWGYNPSPNQKSKRLKNAIVTINSEGLRTGKKFSNPKKIIFYGDSVTYGGSYIDDDDIFSEITCKKLNEIKELYSCGNAGVNAYGIKNIIKRIYNYEKKIPSHQIIITIIEANFYRNFSQINSHPFFTKQIQGPFKATTELILYVIDKIRNNLRFTAIKKHNNEEIYYNNIEILESVNQLVNFYKDQKKKNISIKIIWSPSLKDFSNNKIKYNKTEILNLLKKEIKDDFIEIGFLIENLNIDITKIYYDEIHLSKFGHGVYGEIISKIISD